VKLKGGGDKDENDEDRRETLGVLQKRVGEK